MARIHQRQNASQDGLLKPSIFFPTRRVNASARAHLEHRLGQQEIRSGVQLAFQMPESRAPGQTG